MTKKLSAYIFVCVAVCATSSSMRATGSSPDSGAILLINTAPVVQPFDSLASAGTSNALPAGWHLTELGTGGAAEGAYAAGTGSSNAGGAYSFGTTAADRALGSVGSGTVTPIHYGAKFTNAGSGPITALSISFDGEMWRRGNSVPPNGDKLAFAYSLDATSLNTGTFTAVPSLNFASLAASCLNVSGTVAAGATNGHSANCKVAIAASITGLAVNPGASIWIRWTDTDDGGADDGLAVDNVSVAATFSSDPTPPNTSGTSASPNPASPGDVITLSGTIIPGFNPLSQTYAVTCDLTALGGAPAQTLTVSGNAFSFDAVVGVDAALGGSALACSIADDQNRSTAFTIPIKILLPLNSACEAVATNISAIQGSGLVSSLAGEVVDVEAIVTGDFQGPTGLSGFYMEEPAGERDANHATSEGLFIFSSLPVAAGDRVRVRGTVAEFASATAGVTSRLTELSGVSSVQVCSENHGLPPISDVTLPVGAPSEWERYEGMRVRFTQQLVVAGNVSLGNFGQIDLAPSVLYQPTHSVGNSTSWSAAADLVARSRIALDDGSTSSNANINGGTVAPYPAPGLSNANTLRVGALVNGTGGGAPTPLVGVLDDRFGAYRVHPTEPVTFSNASNPRPDTLLVAAAAAARFSIISANVLNYFTTLGSRGAATPDELIKQRAKIVAQLAVTGGDVIGLSEIQNFANGNTNGVTYTNSAIADLTAALAADTGRNYQFVDTLNEASLAPGNVLADNGTDAIRNAIIYDAGAVTPVGYTALYYQNDQNRPSLARTFKPASGAGADAQTFTVVVNHFRSKGSACGPASDDPFQGNCNGMRVSMSGNVSTWLASNPTGDPAANRRQILIGDFNAYFGEDPIQMLLGGGGYTNLIDLLHGPTAYSYNFASQLGYLDHALVNGPALGLVKDVAHLHINADEPAALQALDSSAKSAVAQVAYFAPNEFAASDHDPIVVGFNPLAGDFSDDGVLDDDDRTALLAAAHGTRNAAPDRRMDMNGDGAITQADFHVWQSQFVEWKKKNR
jgi:predicted extracellular nuclease